MYALHWESYEHPLTNGGSTRSLHRVMGELWSNFNEFRCFKAFRHWLGLAESRLSE